jgi:uncharacterized protein (TIGR02118 family)
MILVSVMYPETAGEAFNYDYFVKNHIPLVKACLQNKGLRDVRVFRGLGAPDGGKPAYKVLSLLSFDSLDGFQQGVAEHGQKIFADRPNFTAISPIFQISEAIG